jgi:ABC-type phosphate/phosphonate transport system substrate-binding protein
MKRVYLLVIIIASMFILSTSILSAASTNEAGGDEKTVKLSKLPPEIEERLEKISVKLSPYM